MASDLLYGSIEENAYNEHLCEGKESHLHSVGDQELQDFKGLEVVSLSGKVGSPRFQHKTSQET